MIGNRAGQADANSSTSPSRHRKGTATMDHQIDTEFLRSVLDYNPITGTFVWRHRADMPPNRNARFAGALAGSNDAYGYRRISINNCAFLAHRLAWQIFHGSAPIGEIDHKNRIKDDNRIGNLRLATHSQNQCNSGKYRNNTSGFKGVNFHRRAQKWRAYIQVDGRLKHLGYFRTPELAHVAYCNAAAEQHGEFAVRNA